MSAPTAVAEAPKRDAAALLRDMRDDLARAAEIGQRLHHADSAIERDRLVESLADAQAALLDELDAALADLARHAPRAAPTARTASAARRVLVVAANATNRRVLAALARGAGHDAACATSLDEAEARVDADQPDTIVMDLDAPGLEAVDAIARLAARADGAARIIGLSESRADDARDRLSAAGLAALLAAPVDPDALIGLLSDAADESDATRRAESAPTFDINALRDLEKLGGEDFARDIAAQFLADAVGLLAAIRTAAEACDEDAFRDQTHALRSCAANVGARSIYEYCLTWRALDAGELARQGKECAETLEREYALVAERIGAYARAEAPLGD